MVRNWDQVLRTHFYFAPRALARALFTVCFALTTLLFSAPSGFSAPKGGPKYAGIVMDANTGRVLYSRQSNQTRYPASLTKMMTLYMVFEALESGKITKKTRIKMSRYAASKPPSKLGLKPGRTLSVEQAIYALVTKSANDVAAAVAEHLGGSERNFAVRMTKRARQLGMSRTTFRNASGLTAKGQVTTAKDMALLGIALREHYPRYYRYFSTRSFKYGKNKYRNYNRLLGKVKGVDGIKTGYTRASGFNLVSSARLNKRSIVAVVMGGKSGKSRNAQMQKLIAGYLKKASRRTKNGMLVAKIGKSRRNPITSGNVVLASAVVLPQRGPMPVFRAQYNDPARLRIEQAHIASVAYVPFEPSLSRASVEAIRGKLLAMNARQAPVPRQSPIAIPDPVTTAAVRPSAPVGNNTTIVARTSAPEPARRADRTAKRKSGWQVQIGAVPDETSALAMLSKARKKLASRAETRMFGKVENYLEQVVKNGTTLYRARFAGFADKKSARSACSALKKRKINCLAIRS